MIKLYVFENTQDLRAYEYESDYHKERKEEIAAAPILPLIHSIAKLPPNSFGPTTEQIKRSYKKRNKASTEKETVRDRTLAKAKTKSTGGTRTCKNCGKPGHMSKTCPMTKKDEPELTQEQINHIKELSESGQTIAQIVMDTGLPSKVVKENMY